ncbi:unnamed protein product [Pylaiella littoralis]
MAETATAADARIEAGVDTNIVDEGCPPLLQSTATAGGVGSPGAGTRDDLRQSLSPVPVTEEAPVAPVTEQAPMAPGCSHTFSDRSSETLTQLEVQWKGHHFPFVNNALETWSNAVKTLQNALSDGYDLRRLDKNPCKKTQAGSAGLAQSRVSIVHVICDQGGKPQKSARSDADRLRHRTGSKEIGCRFKVVLNWPQKSSGPVVSEASFCLRHLTPQSGEAEHERPRALENELTATEIHGQEGLIRLLELGKVETKAIHQALQGCGKTLGKTGKQIPAGRSRATAPMADGASKPKILLCLTGSVATVKASQLVIMLANVAEVKLLVTEASRHFLDRSEAYNREAHAAFCALDPPVRVLGDADEWGAWDSLGDPVLHIELRHWADMLLVAPLSANTMAKLANGLCDNLVTCVARAWDIKNKYFVVAPAMNTQMWEHPMTERHLTSLKEMGVVVVPPASKVLACGDEGVGALADLGDICDVVWERLGVSLA